MDPEEGEEVVSLDTFTVCAKMGCFKPPATQHKPFCKEHHEEAEKMATGWASSINFGGMPLPPGMASPKIDNVLAEAEKLVYGDRAAAYGPADENHTNIVKLFQVWVDMRYPGGSSDLDSYDSCVFNLCQKLSRLAHSLRVNPNAPHRDSLVDGAGYFGVMGKIAEERRAKASKASFDSELGGM